MINQQTEQAFSQQTKPLKHKLLPLVDVSKRGPRMTLTQSINTSSKLHINVLYQCCKFSKISKISDELIVVQLSSFRTAQQYEYSRLVQSFEKNHLTNA